jgi:hypothetical protein
MVNAYKGLSNKLFLFGLHPLDLALTLMVTMLLWGISLNIWLTLFGFVFSYFFLKRHRDVNFNSRKIFFRFLIMPRRIGIKIDDIESYKSCLK